MKLLEEIDLDDLEMILNRITTYNLVNQENMKMETSIFLDEIRYLLKYYYNKDRNATPAAKEICEIYGYDAVSVRVA